MLLISMRLSRNNTVRRAKSLKPSLQYSTSTSSLSHRPSPSSNRNQNNDKNRYSIFAFASLSSILLLMNYTHSSPSLPNKHLQADEVRDELKKQLNEIRNKYSKSSDLQFLEMTFSYLGDSQTLGICVPPNYNLQGLFNSWITILNDLQVTDAYKLPLLKHMSITQSEFTSLDGSKRISISVDKSFKNNIWITNDKGFTSKDLKIISNGYDAAHETSSTSSSINTNENYENKNQNQKLFHYNFNDKDLFNFFFNRENEDSNNDDDDGEGILPKFFHFKLFDNRDDSDNNDNMNGDNNGNSSSNGNNVSRGNNSMYHDSNSPYSKEEGKKYPSKYQSRNQGTQSTQPTPYNPNDLTNMTDKLNALNTLKKNGIEVFDQESNINMNWDYLAGYENVKNDIEETVVNSLKYPELYDNIAKNTRVTSESNRPKAILLEGPPGNFFIF